MVNVADADVGMGDIGTNPPEHSGYGVENHKLAVKLVHLADKEAVVAVPGNLMHGA